MRKKLETALLEIGYEEHGPPDGIPVLLLHGFPDDATSWNEVATMLAAQGFRALAPHTRSVGPTVFRNPDTPRSGQLGALVADAVEFLDGLEVPAAVVVGQDWRARVAQAMAALHPDRVRQLVSLGSYGLTWDDNGFPPPGVLHTLWYQWVLMLDLGPAMLRYDPAARQAFYSYLWDSWSPTWPDRQAAFASVATSLDNPDHAEVTLSAYRHGRAPTVTDSRYDHIDAALEAGPRIDVPTAIVLGGDDGVEQPPPDDPRDRQFYSNLKSRTVLTGVGHWPHREAPHAVAAAVLDVAGRQVATVTAAGARS